MSFNKRYFTKDTIVSALKNGGSSELSSIINVDAMILDEWASKFFDDYEKNTSKFLVSRKLLQNESNFSSSNLYSDSNYWTELNSPACLLVMLYTNPTWIEVSKTLELCKYKPTEEEVGRFVALVKKSRELIVNYITLSVRSKNLDKLKD